MEKYQNKYRIPSARLQSWDYGNNGAYYITICTKNRIHFLGNIVNTDIPTMQLNALGEIAHKYWMEIPNHFPFVELANFVIMPNHTHGILIIDKNNNMVGNIGLDVGNMVVNSSNLLMDDPAVETPKLGVSTYDKKSSNNKNSQTGGKNEKWKPATIGVIINQYKRIVTINARKINPNFGWQSRFHDSIVRNDKSFSVFKNTLQIIQKIGLMMNLLDNQRSVVSSRCSIIISR